MTSTLPDFDRRAGIYNAHARVQADAAAWLADWLPGRIEGPALELGAGTGLFTRYLAARADQLLATDRSPSMVARGTRAVPGVRWEVAEADTPPAREDLRWIFSSSLAQWLPDPAATFSRWRTACAPGGRMIAGWFVRGTMGEFFEACPAAAPFAWRSDREWLDLVAAGGWRVERHETITFRLRHANTALMLREVHNVGAVVPRRFGPGDLRRALRAHDNLHAGPAGLETPFVFLRLEAVRP
jgi:malonyl-CoA O-methyltransferase